MATHPSRPSQAVDILGVEKNNDTQRVFPYMDGMISCDLFPLKLISHFIPKQSLLFDLLYVTVLCRKC
jgi:hypothetical protein